MDRKQDNHLTNSLHIEIEKCTELLEKLRVVLHNSQPELTGKIRLNHWKTSGHSHYKSFEFTIRETNSKTKNFQTVLALKNIGNKLKRKGMFAENYDSARETLNLIVDVITYRNKLITTRGEIIQKTTSLLRENVNLLVRLKVSAKQLDDNIYNNLKSRGIEDLYNHADL